METTSVFPEIRILELRQLTWCFEEGEKGYASLEFILSCRYIYWRGMGGGETNKKNHPKNNQLKMVCFPTC